MVSSDTHGITSNSLEGCRVGCIRTIFCFLEKDIYGRTLQYPRYPLAHIEWYKKLKSSPEEVHRMYQVQKPGEIQGVILPVVQIRQGCMLLPDFCQLPTSRTDYWSSDSVLDACDSFFLNHWQSRYSYQTLY